LQLLYFQAEGLFHKTSFVSASIAAGKFIQALSREDDEVYSYRPGDCSCCTTPRGRDRPIDREKIKINTYT
jgi:hypothetical protein